MPLRESKSKSILRFLTERRRVLLFAIVAIASARIVSTYTVFSHTFDEPAHIACGMDWLANGTYGLEPQHPPLARVAAALGPYLAGARLPEVTGSDNVRIWRAGLEILYRGGQYERTLLLARLGVLPFFWVACTVVYLWGRRYFEPAVGVLAVFLFSLLPAVLAHAGLATTDMACTAFLGAAFLSACVLIEEPSPRHAALFGLCGGLALLSKFSAPVFFIAGVAVARFWYLATEKRTAKEQLGSSFLRLLGLAVAVAGVLVWAGYRFSIVHGMPAPEFWSGLGQLKGHVMGGDHAYLLGRLSDNGFWYFFPVALLVKTPIPFLVLALGGAVLALRHRRIRTGLPLAFSAAILGLAMASPIDIGIRHILPIYIGLSLLAARAIAWMWATPGRSAWMRAAVLLLVVWMVAASAWSHPDYLAYFNAFGGHHPEKLLVDSDLDWGQDVTRLASRLRTLGAHHVTFANFAYADFHRQPGFENIEVSTDVPLLNPAPGWNAVSATMWKKSMRYSAESSLGAQFWANRIPPLDRVGDSILLWYFGPPGGGPR